MAKSANQQPQGAAKRTSRKGARGKKGEARERGNPELVQDILGQFIFAFGQGAGSVRVTRLAIRALRKRYQPHITAATQNGDEQWKCEGIHVLEHMRAVGRLASHQVIVDGRNKITPEDFFRAAPVVEFNSRLDKPRPCESKGPRGDWCP